MVGLAEGDDARDEAGELRVAAGGDVALHGGREPGREGVHEAQAARDEVAVKRDAHGAAERLDFADQADEGLAYLAVSLERLARHAKVETGSSHRRDEGELRQGVALDIGGEMGVDVGGAQDGLELCRLRREAVVLPGAEAVEHAQDLLWLLDDTGSAALREDVDAAVKHGLPWELLLHDGARAKDVEDRDDERLRPCDAPGECDGGIEAIVFDADEEHIGCLVVVVRLHRLAGLDMEIAAVLGVDREAVFLQRAEMCSAREERHVVSRLRQIL